jgi:cytochrome c oxidase cbb3-type subunit III
MSYRRCFRGTLIVMVVLLVAGSSLPAQEPAPGGRGGAGQGGGGGLGAFPQRPPADPVVVERGKALYGVNCQFCHGADTRGGDSGPSLLRSQLVQDDQNGEGIAPVVQNGRPPRMPKFDFSISQIADVAAFLHSFVINSRDPARNPPESIVTGDASTGQRYFTANCASCHSPAGDLNGIAAKFADPRALQQWWLLPGGDGRGGGATLPAGAVATATITLRTGQRFEGQLARIDEFVVSIVDAGGITRSFRRDGESPYVQVKDPLDRHKALLRVYTDKDIHDVTAYLATLR